ncbi:putative phage abortive infection protein [Epibacterium ulvae]|uniref:putative phage abortive infection protein n=1 Tax=Epibacterium ulvae TaxID=1156985 RepID=UPI0024908C35|nr:putative phage abortive infection protein [Epibacterium ulvae]
MFEQTFFNLLNVFNIYIADLTQTTQNEGKEPRKGRDQLEGILKRLTFVSKSKNTNQEPIQNVLDRSKTQPTESKRKTDDEIVKDIAHKFLKDFSLRANDLNSYFRLLYNVIRLVDKSQVDDKRRYVDILRAQLSDSELLLIALNCERPEGAKLKERAAQYNLLKHLPNTIDKVPTIDVCKAIETLSKAERGID